MNEVNATLADPNFYRGALVMGFLMMILMFYAAYMRAQSLYLTAKNGGREKLGKKFYYIVEESEYNQLTLAKLPTFGRKGITTSIDPCLMYTVRHGQKQYWNGTSYAEYASQAKFYPSPAAAMVDHDAFRLVYPLDQKRQIHVMCVSEMDADDVGKKRLLEIAHAQFVQNKGNEDEHSER